MSAERPALYECVPNVSEGRDAALLEACARAIAAAGVTLAHRTSDAAHHRSVFTFFGKADAIRDAALALARVTTARIDLHAHRGEHPRMGALDVLPVVPFGSATMESAVVLVREIATEIWNELGVPAYFYGAAARTPRRSLLANVRGGGFEGLLAGSPRQGPPDTGDIAAHATAGAIACGARLPLIAFNVILATSDLAIAKSIARTLRERDGGLQTLRALGIAQSDGRVQVSCNITNATATPLHRVLGIVRVLAEQHATRVVKTELIGLVSRAALRDVAANAFEVPSQSAQ